MQLILITIVLVLASVSFYLWLVFFAKFFKRETLLEANPFPPQKIGFFLLIAAFYFYFFMPALFMQIASILQIPVQSTEKKLLLNILSHAFYMVIAAWMYQTIYRYSGSQVLEYRETERPELLPEEEDITEVIVPELISERSEAEDSSARVPFYKTVQEQIELGYYGFLFSFLPVLLVIAGTFPFRSEEKLNPLLKVLKEQPGLENFLLAGIMAVIIAPLIEELIFRVILQGFLTTSLHMPAFPAILVTAGVFSAIHGSMDALPILPLALVLGFIYYKTRSYIAVVMTHACFNAFNLLMMSVSLMAEK